MLATVITGPSYEEALKQMEESRPFSQMFEFRLDLLTLSEIKALMNVAKLPLIFTNRKFLSLGPTYFDLDAESSFFEECKRKYPRVKIIASTHKERLSDFPKLKKLPADIVKMALPVDSTRQALEMLLFQMQNRESIIIGTGLKGHITRILGKKFGRKWTYASLQDGEMLSARTLETMYGYSTQNSSTELYGLIGDPVDRSPSHLTHNETFRLLKRNARYVKMSVLREELVETFHLLKQIGFKGLSVTMPHKIKVLSLLDHLDSEAERIGAVNTVCFSDGKSYGYNTDSIGALTALEEIVSVKNKKIHILGSGGSAKAIAYEAKKRGAFLVEKAPYDILINCRPDPIPPPLTANVIFDITFREEKNNAAKRMFIHQAAHQLHHFFLSN